jgi:4-diphosphocytidyl-2-C-methyl-D-erythritol kinase
MICHPPCKINIGLHVIEKRPDKFHEIETVFYPLPLCDMLEVVQAGDGIMEFSSSGLSIPGNPQENICLKAYRLFESEFSIPAVKMHLHKIIPTGAGLGGGSSDGTHTLLLLNQLFGLGLDTNRLTGYASLLGSDCAFFVSSSPSYAHGRGELTEPYPLDLSDYSIVLMVPPVHVSTALAYQGVKPARPAWSLRNLKDLGVTEWRGLVVNDFESHVFRTFPEIAGLRDYLYSQGALYASMSGSGSSLFGLFPKGQVPDLHAENVFIRVF